MQRRSISTPLHPSILPIDNSQLSELRRPQEEDSTYKIRHAKKFARNLIDGE
ncbi:hypothetical protein ACJMK2_038368, partial [Sinanodonta woodiana]